MWDSPSVTGSVPSNRSGICFWMPLRVCFTSLGRRIPSWLSEVMKIGKWNDAQREQSQMINWSIIILNIRFKAEVSTCPDMAIIVWGRCWFLIRLLGSCYVTVFRFVNCCFSSQESHLWLRIFYSRSTRGCIHNANHSVLRRSNWSDTPCQKENIFHL